MTEPGQLGLIDLVIALIIIGSVVGALKRGAGVLAAASGFFAALACWLIAAALIVWGPPSLNEAIARSAVVHTVPPPVDAVSQAGHLFGLNKTGGAAPAPDPAK